MKKLFVLLLAFACAAGAFAQLTPAIAASGGVVLVNEDTQAVFAPDGNGYDTFTFKATDKDGKFGFSMTDENWLSGSLFDATRDWTAWYKGKWTKVFLGKLRNADFRGTLPVGLYANYFYGMDRISGQGILFETTTLGALTLGVNLPIGLVATDTVDVLKSTDIGVKYVIEDLGTVFVLANLDLVAETNKVEFGFKYTGMENLVAAAVYKGTFATASIHEFALGADYTMDKIGVLVEFDAESATEFDGEVAVRASYGINDIMTAYVGGMYDFGGTYDAFVELENDYGNNFGSDLTIGYDGDIYYALKATYSVSF